MIQSEHGLIDLNSVVLEPQLSQHGYHQAAAGPTAISSGEDEDKDDLEDDDEDDLIGEDKKLLEDVKITADDIVIVASFKLPISVYKEGG